MLKATNNLGDRAPAPRNAWTRIEVIDLKPALSGRKWQGSIQVGPCRLRTRSHRYAVGFDNLRDFIMALEKILIDCGGRIFRDRTPIVARARLELEQVRVYLIPEAPVKPPPDFGLDGFYMALDCPTGETYHNFFVHLEDLVQLLHRCAKDVQGLQRKTAAGAVAAVFHDQSPGGN